MFVPLHGMLMGVTPEQYKEIHRQKCRQKYVDERSAENGDFSNYMLTIDNFNGEDIMVDSLQNVRDSHKGLVLQREYNLRMATFQE